ncbi:uncharacterized protein KD926_011207 [Aspergillus affinis]|uniref:uncharacterized protein n=1 Tax=Aspergillus affinis TaxID=1070780 RepID=UPI0022FED93E|nr:uncharacterized protein KD926_011207 [Aspergillus affinis]KAI9038165.1 hypothetical protein KD926_011207 [Aspergillus affinis]
MEHPAFPPHLDQLSPPESIASPNFDVDSDVHEADLDNDAMRLPDRIAGLAHLMSQNSQLSSDDSTTLHQHPDFIESLPDPRPRLTQEVAKCRPPSPQSGATKQLPGTPPALASPTTEPVRSANEISQAQLSAVLSEVTALGAELCQRRKESSHIYDRFTRERQAQAQKISDLEEEIDELKADIIEGSAEREALDGTVRGFENWIDGWQRQHDEAVAKRSTQVARQRKWMKRRMDDPTQSNTEVLLEGICAWMRGWADAQEGFRSREEERRLRREGRRHVPAETDQGESPVPQWHSSE